jgi:tripartite-type tricarboxylate transporter receptor subunit TctC
LRHVLDASGADLAAAAKLPGSTQCTKTGHRASTLGIVNIAFVANPSLMKKVPYETETDLVPISLISTATLVMAVHPSVPARSLKASIALAKSAPGTLHYGSAGTGAGNHLMTERFSHTVGGDRPRAPGAGQSVVPAGGEGAHR